MLEVIAIAIAVAPVHARHCQWAVCHQQGLLLQGQHLQPGHGHLQRGLTTVTCVDTSLIRVRRCDILCLQPRASLEQQQKYSLDVSLKFLKTENNSLLASMSDHFMYLGKYFVYVRVRAGLDPINCRSRFFSS